MRWILSMVLFATAGWAREEHAALLQQVANSWLDERDRWAFTQVVREFDGKDVKQERIERDDPSRGTVERWRLISINGTQPTEKERSEWQARKNKKQRRPKPGLSENFDFANAKVVGETAETVRYELPLRSSIDWLFPISKVELIITINKEGPALEQVQAQINEPFRVALGLAKILDIELDVQMAPPPTADPADAKPSGTASAVVTKFGDRVEYFWKDFKRVDDGSEKTPVKGAVEGRIR